MLYYANATPYKYNATQSTRREFLRYRTLVICCSQCAIFQGTLECASRLTASRSYDRRCSTQERAECAWAAGGIVWYGIYSSLTKETKLYKSYHGRPEVDETSHYLKFKRILLNKSQS